MYESFAEKNSAQVADVLQQTKSAIQSYMIGLLIEALIVAALNSTALLILGVKYAILLALLGALLNMLPTPTLNRTHMSPTRHTLLKLSMRLMRLLLTPTHNRTTTAPR